MFSGIVRELGIIKAVRKSHKGTELRIHSPQTARRVSIDSSVAVNGVCLTVAGKTGGVLRFMLMPETLARTTFQYARVGERVGVEPSLRAGDEIGGHFVYGHVDGRGEIVDVRRVRGAMIMSFGAPKALLRYMVLKGTVAVDGVSLTIMKLSQGMFTVSLLQQTLDITSLGAKKIGDEVNIEIDMINKFLAKQRTL